MAVAIRDRTTASQLVTVNTDGSLIVQVRDKTTVGQFLAVQSDGSALVQPQAITKGTQGANGFTIQQLRDAGRNMVHYYMLIPIITTATDTLQSLTGTKGSATVAATTTPAVVTTGTTFRVTRFAATYVAIATAGIGIVRLRFNTGGAVTITSPIAATIAVGAAAATAGVAATNEASLDEGWEFPAGTGVGISVQGFGATIAAAAVGYVMASITGYEY